MLKLPTFRAGAIAGLAAALLLTASQLSVPAAHAEDVLPSGPVAAPAADAGASSDVAGIAEAAADYTGSAKSAAELADAASAADNVALNMDGKNLIAGDGSGAGVSVAKDGEVTLSAPGTPDIGISAAGDAGSAKPVGGVLVQTEVAPSTDVVTRATQDGVQLVAVLADQNAPNTIDFDLDLPKGAKLIQQADGSVSVVVPVTGETFKGGELERYEAQLREVLGVSELPDQFSTRQLGLISSVEPPATEKITVDQRVASIDRPWAADATGQGLETRYELDGDTLRQVVVADEGTAFPVAADPRIRLAWYGVSIDFSKAETKKISRGAGDCTVIYGAAAAIAGMLEAIPVVVVTGLIGVNCAIYGRVADNALADKKCISIKVIPVGIWLLSEPWIGKCYK